MPNTSLPPDHADRMERVRLALDGLSIGDAFGERFMRENIRMHLLDDEPFLTPGPWPYSDDTAMALGIVEVLDRHGRIEQDVLAQAFARRFRSEPWRGYGPGMIRLLSSVAEGGIWQLEAKTLFSGMGSFGNGSAMRVAPVGAYFTNDGLEVVAEQARLSAEVTHRHLDGQAGGIAIAVAGAYAWQNRGRNDADVQQGMFAAVLAHTPSSDVRAAIEAASTVPFERTVQAAASWLGNGRKVTCQDTVPFCLWVAARHFGDYCRAIWETVRVGGDIDTNAAIVGGIAAMSCGREGISTDWLERREAVE